MGRLDALQLAAHFLICVSNLRVVDPACMRALHEGEADCNLANKKDNMTPLDWAIRNQQVEMVAYLKSLGFRPTPPPPPPPAPAVGDDAAGGGKKKKGKKKKKSIAA